MSISSRAPGKIMLCGEYAVLEGAPALLLAIDRRVQVHLNDSKDGLFHVCAPNIGIDHACATYRNGCLQWQNLSPVEAHKLNLVTAIVGHMIQTTQTKPAIHLELDSSAFYQHSDRKLGLGSSAALTVALVGALSRWQNRSMPSLKSLLNLHNQIQQGRGSGADIATSLMGGAVKYTLCDGVPRCEPVDWPQDLYWCVVWTRKSASTGDALARLDAWRVAQPLHYEQTMQRLRHTANDVVRALAQYDVSAMLLSMDTYRAYVGELGRQCGVDIICSEHRQLQQLAARFDLRYKSCGAGGGDVGIALTSDLSALQKFKKQATVSGFDVLDIAMDQEGWYE